MWLLPSERSVIGLPIVAGRPDADGDARQPGDRLDDADELRRAENPVEVAEARRKVSDADRAALSLLVRTVETIAVLRS